MKKTFFLLLFSVTLALVLPQFCFVLVYEFAIFESERMRIAQRSHDTVRGKRTERSRKRREGTNGGRGRVKKRREEKGRMEGREKRRIEGKNGEQRMEEAGREARRKKGREH